VVVVPSLDPGADVGIEVAHGGVMSVAKQVATMSRSARSSSSSSQPLRASALATGKREFEPLSATCACGKSTADWASVLTGEVPPVEPFWWPRLLRTISGRGLGWAKPSATWLCAAMRSRKASPRPTQVLSPATGDPLTMRT
jgi:hypothetical protein